MPNRDSYRPGGLFLAAGIGILLAATVIAIAWTLSVSAQADSWAISKSVNATNVHPGDEVMYTVTFTNTGTIAQTAIMTDVIPFGVTYVPGSVTGGGGYNTGPGRINWTGSVNPSQVVVVTFRVTVVEPGTLGPYPILNEARVDNTWSNAVTVYSTPAIYSLAITKSASATDVQPGDVVTYTLNFTNTGTVDQSVIMTDVIPFGVTYVPGSVTGGGVYNTGPARINWTGLLPAGAFRTVTFAVTVVEPGTLGPYPILNEARLNNVWSNAVTIYSRGTGGLVYLPIVMRNYESRPVWPWSEP